MIDEVFQRCADHIKIQSLLRGPKKKGKQSHNTSIFDIVEQLTHYIFKYFQTHEECSKTPNAWKVDVSIKLNQWSLKFISAERMQLKE